MDANHVFKCFDLLGDAINVTPSRVYISNDEPIMKYLPNF